MKIVKLLIITYLFSTMLYAQATEVTYKWFEENHEEIVKIIKDPSANADHVINNILVVFKNRDGAIGLEISYYIEKALIIRPKDMIKGFYNYPEEYKDWLNKIGPYLLTDYSGDEKDELEITKQKILKSLENFINTNEETKYKEIALELYNKIKITPVRVVE